MKKLTTPWWIYFSLFILSLAFILPYNLKGDTGCWIWVVICNFGYGIFGSLFVALLIDFANTKLKKEKDIENMKVLSTAYREAFLDLRDCMVSVAENRYGTDGNKRTFNEWIDYVLALPHKNDGETDEDVYNSILDVELCIEKVKKAAEELSSLLLLNLGNEKNTQKYRTSIRGVSGVATYIIQSLEEEKYATAAKVIKNRLVPKYINNNSEDGMFFLEPYCEDRYTEEDILS